jgi:hypothetical protein
MSARKFSKLPPADGTQRSHTTDGVSAVSGPGGYLAEDAAVGKLRA